MGFYVQEKSVEMYGQSHMVRMLFPKKSFDIIQKCNIDPFKIVGCLKRDYKTAAKKIVSKPKVSFEDAFNK